jgi:hypothetical protein|tara:strand:- start:484 stop:927 length:444 start_codon:yes stop_codon:yes gene_type:complete
MPDKKDIIIIALGCMIALGLGYWVGKPKKGVYSIEKPLEISDNNAAKSIKELTKKDVAGVYEFRMGEQVYRDVFLENGICEEYVNGVKGREGSWKIVDKEIHVEYGNSDVAIYRIIPDEGLLYYAIIKDAKRQDFSIGIQSTYKKIK